MPIAAFLVIYATFKVCQAYTVSKAVREVWADMTPEQRSRLVDVVIASAKNTPTK